MKETFAIPTRDLCAAGSPGDLPGTGSGIAVIKVEPCMRERLLPRCAKESSPSLVRAGGIEVLTRDGPSARSAVAHGPTSWCADVERIRGLTIGNAQDDGAAFRHWFVGDLSAWSGTRFGGPRDTKQVSIKWGVHPTGELRPGGWADGDAFVTLSVLVSGDFVLSFETDAGDVREVRLERPGDYAIWTPGVRHTWRVASACVVLTVRWQEQG